MLTLFGSLVVAFMFLTYWLENYSKWFVALFAVGCAASSAYAWLAGTYPFFVIEALWAAAAAQRFVNRWKRETA